MHVSEFHYRVPWRAKGLHPGYHRGSVPNGGVEFRGHASLLDKPDPRRLDFRAMLKDPFEQMVVKVYQQKTAIPVYAVVDLSASMGRLIGNRKLNIVADFVMSLGYSAYRTGDAFGLIGCDARVRTEFFQHLTRLKSAAVALARRLHSFIPTGVNSQGLRFAPELMVKQRALVFLLSDFFIPSSLLEQILETFHHHWVVPVVLSDSIESEGLPRFGIARVVDSETGRQRMLLLRPDLSARIRESYTRHRASINEICLAYGRRPLFITDRFNSEYVTNYFYS